MRKLGLLLTTDDALHSFSVSSQEAPTESYNIISTASPNGISFQPVTAYCVYAILAVAHFRSQARVEDEISHSIVAKAFSVITPHLAKLFVITRAWSIPVIVKEKYPSEFRPIAPSLLRL